MRLEANRVFRLPKEDFGLSTIRLFNGHLDGTRTDRNRFFRKELVVVKNLANGARIVREVAGAGELAIGRSWVGLDYNSRDALGVKSGRDHVVDLQVYRASGLDRLRYYWNLENRSERFASRLTILGFAMSAYGTIMSLLSVADVF